MKITILGTGAYGLALSFMFHKNNHTITMWTKFEAECNLLKNTRENPTLLPGIKVPEEIIFTTNLIEAVKDADIILIAVPAKFVDDLCLKLQGIVAKNTILLIGSKGIEQDTCRFVSDVVEHYLSNEIAVISGPSFAIDIANNVPIGLTLASRHQDTCSIVKQALENDRLKLRPTDDIIGVEICGAIKNVIAIASGMLDGMQLPISTKAMFITESLHDIKSLINALDGNGKTILSFAGFGDLLLTCTSEKSRNFSFGKLIGSGASREELDRYLQNTTVEGLYTLQSIYQLLRNKQVDMPIIDLIYDIVNHRKQPEALLTFLIEKA